MLAEEGSDVNATARHRAELLKPVLEGSLAGAVRVNQGASKTARTIERVAGAAKSDGTSLVLRLWNGWEHGTAQLDEIKAADVSKDATLHLIVPIHRNSELSDAIVAQRAAALCAATSGNPHHRWRSASSCCCIGQPVWATNSTISTVRSCI